MLGDEFVLGDVYDKLKLVKVFQDVFGGDGGEDFGGGGGHGLLHNDDGPVDSLLVHPLQVSNPTINTKTFLIFDLPSDSLDTDSGVFREEDVELISRVGLALDDKIKSTTIHNRSTDTIA